MISNSREATGVDTYNSAAKTYLTSLEVRVDKLDTDKLTMLLKRLHNCY